MAVRGDLLVLKTGLYSSGTAEVVIAESTDVSIDISAEALETTSQTDGLNATFIGGKVTGTASGSFLCATSQTNFDILFDKMNGGTSVIVSVELNGTEFLNCDGVITQCGLQGGISDSLVTGSYSIQLSGNPDA